MLARFEASPFTVVAMGPVGHLYFKQAVSPERKREVALRLVREGGVRLPEAFPDSR